MNPIFRKELRSLLRERRGWLVPVVYTGLLAAVVYLFLVPAARNGGYASDIGQMLAGVVAVVQSLILFVVAPLQGASAIAGERERGTLTLLLASPIRRPAIGLGKAAAGILYTLVLLSGSLPIAAISLLFGGPDAATLAGLYLTHVIIAVTLVCLGLAVSTALHRTWSATLVAIGLGVGLAVVTTAVWVALGSRHGSHFENHWVLAFNPGFGMALFLGGDEIGSPGAWLQHYAAMLTIAGASLAFTMARLRRMRD